MIWQILDIIAPVFLLIAAGAGAAKLGWLSELAIDGMMGFALKFAAPSLLFLSVSRLDISATFQWPLMASFYIGAASSFFLALLLARTLFKRRPGEAVAVAFGALFSNSLILGFPIAERAYGAESLVTNVALVSIHAPFCYLLGITAMELSRADKQAFHTTARTILTLMFRNPLMVGIGLGFAVNLSGLTLPTPALSAIEMLARTTLPVALFGIGGVLTRYALGVSLPQAGMVSTLSLLVHPAIVYLLATRVFVLEPQVMRSAVLTAAMAPGANAFLFASMYSRGKGVAASAILLATSASVFTVSGWIWFLGG